MSSVVYFLCIFSCFVQIAVSHFVEFHEKNAAGYTNIFFLLNVQFKIIAKQKDKFAIYLPL